MPPYSTSEPAAVTKAESWPGLGNHEPERSTPAGWPVRVTYTYGANGRLHVSAQLKGHTASVSADFERENRLPDEDLDMWATFIEDELAVDET